jgi:outer membrane receptor protein involved in Fe transport
VVVQVGQLTPLMPKLAAGGSEQTVEVSATADELNFQSPDLSSVLTSNALQNIPVQNRRWSSLALTTPGVVADSSGFGLISVRGMSTLLNDVLIDGADDNQAFFSEERGRTREGYSTTANSVQEFVVNTGVYSAQYGRAAGGVINSVTRSGTNKFHGDLLFNDLDKGFGAYDPGAVSPTNTPLKPKDLRKIYGGSLGGPILHDKLFFFYTYDQLSHINPAIARAKSYGSATTPGSFLDQPTATTPGTCNTTTGYLTGSTSTDPNYTLDSQTCTLAARLKETYAAAVTTYDTDLAALQTDLGIVPRVGYQEINMPKVEYQLNPKERVSFLYNRERWDAPGDVQTNTSADYSIDAFGNDFVKLDYGVAKLDSQITSNISNEVLYQYSRELDDESQQPYSAYTLANLVAAGGSVSGAAPNAPGGTIPYIGLDTSIGFNLGSPYYSYRLAYPEEWKWQAEDVLYWQLGNHSIRFGGDFLHNSDLLHQTPYYYGDYSYSTLANYFTDLATKGSNVAGTGRCNTSGAVGSASASGVGTYDCYSSAYQDVGASEYAISTMDYAGFVQDNWKFSSRLTFELGLRYDYEHLPPAPANLTTATGTFAPYTGLTNNPSDKNNFGPRIGFSWDVYGTGKTVLRGGYGLYYGRVLNGVVASIQFGSGSPNGQYQIASTKPTAATAPVFPYPFSGGAAGTPSSYFLSKNLQNPQVHEVDLQMQQELGHGTVFQVSYIGSLGRELPNYLDVNLNPTTMTTEYVSIVGGPGAGQTAVPVPTFTGYGNTALLGPNATKFSNVTELTSNINSSYNGFVAEIQNRSFRGLQFDANYTWSHALDYNQNATSTTSTNNWLNPYGSARQNYGTSQFNVGNRFVGYALYTFPNSSTTSALKYLINGWTFNDTFQMQNGLPYSAEIDTGYNSAAALNSSWDGAPSVYYIPTIGINTFQVPRAIVDDARLQKGFTIREGMDLLLSADLYNVANKQNFSTSDINENAYNFGSTTVAAGTPAVGSLANPAVLTYIPNTGPGVGFGSHSTSNDSGFLYTPREIQIGARLNF